MGSANGENSVGDHVNDCDVLVIGGGVVGLAVLRSATLQGYKCVLVEAEPDLLSCASGSNSGISCTGVDASPGTLERALIRDAASRIRGYCREMNIPTKNSHPGSLVCLWPWDCENEEEAQDKLKHVALESWDAGDCNTTILSTSEVLKMEPDLNPECRGAVHIPGELVLDSWLYSVSYAVHARENGAQIYTSCAFSPEYSTYDEKTKAWTVVCNDTAEGETKTFVARCVVNCAGIQADLVQNRTPQLPDASWSARPRRGQYRIFAPSGKESSSLRINHPIQPVPSQFTKGIFVFPTIYNQIVVGPTALDQESRTDRTPHEDVATSLTTCISRILPHLDTSKCVGEYVGIRPGTDKRDYQIHMQAEERWISVAGIRSTGLTASLGIGRHVVHLVQCIAQRPDAPVIKTTPLPNLQDMIQDFKDRKNGRVMIHGHVYKVTHPLTVLGWEKETRLTKTNTSLDH